MRQVYNYQELKNQYIQTVAKEAIEEGYIDKSTAEKIVLAHPFSFYTPNLFVTIGLGLLTLVVVLAASGIGLLLIQRIDPLFFIIGIGCYCFLEYITGTKKHLNSGVDTVLMILTAVYISNGISSIIGGRNADTILSFILFILSAWIAFRFVSPLAAITAVIAALVFSFNLYTSFSESTIKTFPYLLMLISAAILLWGHRKVSRNIFSVYDTCYHAVKLISLLAFYAAGNYYIVDHLVDSYYFLRGSTLSASWFFWCWTLILPLIYLAAGLKMKDLILIRTGIILAGLSIVTFRMYHALFPLETAMILAGILLISISYFLMVFLRHKRHGFIYNSSAQKKSRYQDLEAFAISQAFIPNTPVADETTFGGGSFGGAGAGSSY